jgi:membrane protein
VVPLLAVAVSIAGALGIGTERFIAWVVATFAAGSPSAQAEILALVEHVEFGRLGTVSAAVLFLTSVLAIGNVESALNRIWGVAEHRGWGRRFSDYLAVLVVGPVLGGVALSLSTSMYHPWLLERLMSLSFFQRLYHFGLTQFPTVILSMTFTFLYACLPNTRVRWSSAAIGGVVAGVLVVAAQHMYLDLSVGVTRADLFFGSFAALPLLFAWIYVLWAVVLFGAEIAFAHQNLQQYRREVRGAPAGPAEREAIGLRAALEIARRFRDGDPALDAAALSDVLDEPVRTVREVSDRLRAANILLLQVREDGSDALLLARPAEQVSVQDLLAALRGGRALAGGDSRLTALVDGVLSELEAGASQAARNRTLADLLEALPRAGHVDHPTHAL